MNHMPYKPSQTGFTLLEVIIATVLLAVMMTLLLGGMRVGASSWEQGERLADRTSRLMVVDNFFRSHLSDVKPLFESPTDNRLVGAPPRLLFRGGTDWLEYAGALPPQVRGGIYKFRLHLAEEGERRDLKLAMRPFSTGEKGGSVEPIEDVLVLENVQSLHFSYYKKSNANNANGESKWLEEWKESFLPSLIRIEISLRGEPAWPSVVVAPRAETGQ
ncbi:MAG: prepilin-type N-terminal cleavage/methylation domain-containing protein [Candidatus Methylumidiphilus sp.]